MRKILIVNNNLDMGGIQKSLVNLLKEVYRDYDITLLLFSKSGALLNDVPSNVKIITPNKCYQLLGLTKSELKHYPFLFCLKYVLMKIASIFSRRSAMKLLGIFQKKIKGYDTVISYSHLPHHNCFGNGCGDFVLDKVECKNKICMIHCDYLHSGYMSEKNNKEYSEFDKIACCSESVRSRFIQGTQIQEDKVYTQRNFYDFDIIKLAKENPYRYENGYVNLVTVARLSLEKGVNMAIDALYAVGRADLRYYIIGDGPQKDFLQEKIKEYHMEKQILLLGEQQNPYRYMINADYLLVPSLHEAAPMVFDEANILGVRILSTNTTSAKEMIGDNGLFCDNSVKGIELLLSSISKIGRTISYSETNQLQQQQFLEIIG